MRKNVTSGGSGNVGFIQSSLTRSQEAPASNSEAKSLMSVTSCISSSLEESRRRFHLLVTGAGWISGCCPESAHQITLAAIIHRQTLPPATPTLSA